MEKLHDTVGDGKSMQSNQGIDNVIRMMCQSEYEEPFNEPESMPRLPIPTYDRVLIRKKKFEEVTQAGIIIPEKCAEQKQRAEKIGIIIAVGEGYRMPDGTVTPLHVEKGMTVYFNPHMGVDVKWEDETLIFLREEDILGIQR